MKRVTTAEEHDRREAHVLQKIGAMTGMQVDCWFGINDELDVTYICYGERAHEMGFRNRKGILTGEAYYWERLRRLREIEGYEHNGETGYRLTHAGYERIQRIEDYRYNNRWFRRIPRYWKEHFDKHFTAWVTLILGIVSIITATPRIIDRIFPLPVQQQQTPAPQLPTTQPSP